MKNLNAIINLAKAAYAANPTAAMRTSAELAHLDACLLRDRGDVTNAAKRAITSIAYSEGILSKRYAVAVAIQAVGL